MYSLIGYLNVELSYNLLNNRYQEWCFKYKDEHTSEIILDAIISKVDDTVIRKFFFENNIACVEKIESEYSKIIKANSFFCRDLKNLRNSTVHLLPLYFILDDLKNKSDYDILDSTVSLITIFLISIYEYNEF
ncbi:hypothetical protein SHELI_v1c09510 [Spiroplasma helicoides]|uniref:Uncharacterized protein n=1 Tax=Spiroplasma helicoides TaxID=216938 RepID=A0A1B3SLW8_9MOLU|nr:hypothetical protein [Spiroplasma helicoides]AOG60900.1 hypothetical protein SHELI_v1c09510 [Spiroplasma helicoides]